MKTRSIVLNVFLSSKVKVPFGEVSERLNSSIISNN